MATLDELRQEHEELTGKLAQPAGIPRETFAALAARQKELREILDLTGLVERTRAHVAEHEAELTSDDAELRQLAAEELPKLRANLERLGRELAERLNPPDPHARKEAIIEIRAGTGGDESALFARDLFAMYTRFAERRGWSVSRLSESHGDLGGYKEVIAEIRGAGVFGVLRLESGVHRVQRIPETEKTGRIHTSTATVAVLPKADPRDLEIQLKDLRIDTFRAGGHGGQHVQKTESAVRITHLPTGLVATCQNERSQHANKEQALSVLRARLLARREQEQRDTEHALRRAQIGKGGRSEKIRTYNFPQDRVTDHRLKQSWHNIDGILAGDLDQIVAALGTAAQPRGPF